MEEPTSVDTNPSQVVFRPSKKRKHFRHRPEENDGATTGDATSQNVAPHASTEDGEATTRDNNGSDEETKEANALSVAEALRLRNARKSRLKGVEFRPEAAAKEEAKAELGLVPDEDGEAVELGVSRRFAPQVGLVGELVNKHMEEYIESELARRYAADKDVEATTSQQPGSSSAEVAAGTDPLKRMGEQPAMKGRLHEVDLGEEARLRNAAMTEKARRRLAGEDLDDESEDSRKHGRLGKDGKPWRGRKRRASDDIKRDQMVEALMSENKLDVYDVTAQADTGAGAGADEAADEKIAANFRREFLDAMALRRAQRRRHPAPPPKPGAKQEEILRGPKLGGSRNARAAMRDILLSQQEEKKKRR
ncbi:hypothetical protein M406DRAFT_291968 [Cryphonectria parasitica EP155]|uniref:Uncharacterized protein n=1 Tax=Cryphonectria parasitica (strain ATCC 38755 / EP155) TaxID=660469 RepID=A0A9P4Y1H8_CRYP1|nr:uncharacterized protein M406DRAFT_291968 [Cryphonectria parasitica EP155]KAF3764789.1 hypothetical protein M406DRAFT_291968 [Cryphonectria parasitica EP155]